MVDALGEDAKCFPRAPPLPPTHSLTPHVLIRRTQLFSWYSLLLLRDYRRIFGSHSEAGQLDNISRRFAWFRRILKTHEEENALLFPESWNVGAVLAGGFSEVTR